jgi:hypothetical protein
MVDTISIMTLSQIKSKEPQTYTSIGWFHAIGGGGGVEGGAAV